MSQVKKISLYELNPRFYKDQSGNGTGDLLGLASKIDYLKYLGVDGVILQDILSTDSQNDKIQNFQTVASELGTLNDLKRVLALAKKDGTKVLIELNIGSIKQNHNWFENAIVEKTAEFANVIDVSDTKKINLTSQDEVSYKQLGNEEKYYLVDNKTKEIPLNWKSDQVMDQFLKVIRFWKELEISGFVLKNFEYLAEPDKKTLMSESTLIEMRKFYTAIKNVDDRIIIIGKSNLIDPARASRYTDGVTQVLDYFMSSQISLLGTRNGDIDYVDKFKVADLVAELKKVGDDASNIIAFGSSKVGRIVSRWGSDSQYHQESAKALAILLHLSNASSSIYYGDEIGAKNIGLTHLDDFQDKTMAARKKEKVKTSYSEETFMDAQILQNPINARSLMAWNDTKNGGFSTAEKTVTPVSSSYALVNVELEYQDRNSILNFNRELLRIAYKSAYAPIIAFGKYKITRTLTGIVKVTFEHNAKEVAAYVNLSLGARSLILNSSDGKVILSTYPLKTYTDFPSSLAPYEGIVVANNVNDDEKVSMPDSKAEAEAAKAMATEQAKARAEAEKQKIIDEELAAREASENEKMRLIEEAKKEAAQNTQKVGIERTMQDLPNAGEDLTIPMGSKQADPLPMQKPVAEPTKQGAELNKDKTQPISVKKVEVQTPKENRPQPKDRSRLSEDQVAKTTQVIVDTENIEDFIQKLNKKEK